MEEKVVNSASKSIEDFSVGFHKNVASEAKGNFITSPLGAHTVLAMAAYGANGNTAKEMRQALHLPENDEQAHQDFQNYIDTINNLNQVAFTVANKICADKGVTIKEQFKEMTDTYFRSETTTVDFSNAIESTADINKWCAEKTNGKINKVITPDDVSADVGLVLLNAVYFQGSWAKIFYDCSTCLLPFHINGTTTVEVPMMFVDNTFLYKDLPEFNAEVIGLPYLNRNLRMVVIVPKEIDGLSDLEKNLENIHLDYEKDLNTYEMKLRFPKFKVKTTLDLSSHLVDLGMKEMFTENANFSGITNTGVKVGKVLQKTFIEVNETGTEAAICFSALLCKVKKWKELEINVNKPFVYKIVYKNNTLFSGRLLNPLDN